MVDPPLPPDLPPARERASDSLSERTTEATPASATPLGRIGEYQLLRLIGAGGMGVVYEAEQQHPRRSVALKVIRGGRYVTEHHVRLFQREAQTLARLHHPSIATIYESGRTADGEHFFAMELVHGETLGRHLGARPSTPLSSIEVRYRLLLFRKVAEAVAYAHNRGVIHRDLKPSNVLVVRDSLGSTATGAIAVPEIKILDFGLARITDTDLAVSSLRTDPGAVQGTLPYMSPEQVRGNPDEIDLRSDVYALGVLLYEMLTGHHPLEVGKLSLPEAARVICDETPEPPSRSPGGGRQLDADVGTIVMKALEKEPGRRYQSAAAMVEDVDRYLANQPILARPPSAIYQFRKLVSRHRGASAMVATVMGLLAAFGVTMSVQANRIAHERDRANQEAAASKQVSEFLVNLFEVSDPFESKGNTITAREVLDRGAQKIERELKDQPLLKARLMDTMGNVYRRLGLYDESEKLLQQALKTREDLLGPDHEDVAETLMSLAWVYLPRTPQEALLLAQRADAIRERQLGPNQEQTAWSLYLVGSCEAYAGRPAEARKALERAMGIFERTLGPNDIAVAWCLNDIALALDNAGDHVGARPFAERALQIKEKTLGPDHPDLAIGLMNYASALTSTGQAAAAGPYLARAITVFEKAYGPDHPAELAHAYGNYGEWLRQTGDLTGAREFLSKSVDLQDRTGTGDTPNMSAYALSLAMVLRDLGNEREAETLFKRALTVRERNLAPDSPAVAEVLEEYAKLLRSNGRVAEAKPMEERARAIKALQTGTH